MRNIAGWLLLSALTLAGCGARKPPLSPKQALETFRLPPDFRIELVAAEPEVVDPVAMAFDERGRLFVVEMPDYPLDPQPKGRIKLLEDADGDGRYERSTIFAEGLHMPDGVMRWRNGILVACAPDILYLEDTNGDGRADLRRVVLTGFAATNPQLRVNGLQYGIDNWIYAAYPRVPTPRRYVKEFGDPGQAIRFPDHPEVAPVDIRSVDLRFHPDKARLEAVAGNSQFGNAFDAWGNRFTVWNNDHVRHVVVPRQYLSRNPYLAVPVAMQSASDHENAATVYPITVDPHYIHDSQIGHFTSACGLSVYAGGNLPAEFEGNSFTCEPVHNLVHRDILVPKGATFVARRAYDGREFLASTDSWFRPVFTTTGTDGALYVADYYRFTVEHPEFVPPELLKQIDFQPGNRLGRIYRVTHKSSKPAPKPALDKASPQELVASLSNPNLWWRMTAQRLLVDRQDRAAVGPLEELARQGQSPMARVHALWTLDGLEALSSDLVLQAMGDGYPAVREHGVRLAEKRLSDPKLKEKVLQLADDPDDRVQFQVACTLAQLPPEQSFRALERIALRHMEDQWFRIAVLTGASENAAAWFRMVAAQEPSKGREDFLRRTASILGAKNKDREIADVLAAVTKSRAEPAHWWCAAALDGLADGLKQGSGRGARLSAGQPVLLSILNPGHGKHGEVAKAALRLAAGVELVESAELRGLIRRASDQTQKQDAAAEDRVYAISVLGLDPSGSTAPLLAKFLDPKQPEEIQIAAASALANLRRPEVAAIFVDRWRASTGPVRNVLLAGFFSDRSRLPALLDAVAAEQIQPWALGPGRKRQLLQHPAPEIRSRAQALLSESVTGSRKAVFERYLPAVRMSGNRQRGRKVFEKVCSECHKIGSVGFEVGPDLLSVTTRHKEVLLADILIPNEAIETGYEEYLVETTDGRSLSGVLAKETATTLTLRRAKGEEDTILRSSVKSLRSLSVSPMPDDLEKSISVEAMADLIAYIKSLR